MPAALAFNEADVSMGELIEVSLRMSVLLPFVLLADRLNMFISMLDAGDSMTRKCDQVNSTGWF